MDMSSLPTTTIWNWLGVEVWLSKDGRVNTRWKPIESIPSVRNLLKSLDSLDDASRRELEVRIERYSLQMISEIRATRPYSALESEFEAVAVPDDILESCKWADILNNFEWGSLSQVDLRWRLDVLVILDEAIANCD